MRSASSSFATSAGAVPLGWEPEYLAHGLESEARVYRTGTVEGVLDRMIERARDAYGFINETLKKQREEQR